MSIRGHLRNGRRATLRAVTGLAVAALVASCGGAQSIEHSGDGPGLTPYTSTPTPGTAPLTPTPSTSTVPPSTGPANLPSGFGAGPAGRGMSRFYGQHVSWTACGGSDQCADIWVPLDYTKPDGEAITIKAKRQSATDPGKRRGTLFINPGGPGGSGIDYLGFIGLGSDVTSVYDVVGFDPRGVGQSTPIDCVSDHDLDVYDASDPSPDTPVEVTQFEAQWKHFTDGCVRNSGPLLVHVSTIEAARDMDVLRAVVGDRLLNYFGASYGTYLGATYAALFPTKVGKMVLDGAVDPLAKPITAELGQAAGFEQQMTSYLTYCVGQGRCPLGSSVAGARNRLINLFTQIDAHPLPTSSGRQLTEGLAFLGVIVPLYNLQYWPYETQALRQAVQGSGDTLLALADNYTGRQRDGSYKDNSMEVQSAVNCLDHPEHETLAQIERGGRQFMKVSPVFGPVAMWWPYACSNWPVKPTEPRPNYAAKGAPPIVVVGTTRDPATPYQQAVNLSKELDSGVLLSRNGDGHTAYDSGNTCIKTAVDTYLVGGAVPKNGTMC